jgi:hypothetical protein
LEKETLARRSALVATMWALACAAALAYFRAFSFFGVNDDEGYIQQTVRSYLQGHRLFDEIFTQYGPAFYVLESIIHRTLGAPLTHDVERFVTIAMWVGASAAIGWTVLRITRSWIAAALTFAGVFVHLMPLISEPGHPQGPLMLVVALMILEGAWHPGTLSPRQAALAGTLTAFALLVKINIGVYLAIGFGLPLLFLMRPVNNRLLVAVNVLAAIAVSALPFVVMRTYVQSWALAYATIVSLSVASSIVAFARGRHGAIAARVPVTFALSIGAAAACLVGPALLQGTSVAALINGTIVRPSGFDRVFFMPLVLPASGLIVAGVGLALVIGLTLRQPRPAQDDPVMAGAKALVAVAALSLGRSGYDSQLAYLTPLLWLAAWPSGKGAAMLDSGRAILVLIAVLQSLQAYPVAGTQMAFATVLMIPIAFVCLHDALAFVVGRRAELRWLPRAVQVACIAAGVVFYRPSFTAAVWRGAYDASFPARLKGAERVHMPATELAPYQWLVATAQAECKALVTLPGLYSFNAWSGVPTVNTLNATTWMTLLTPLEQESIWKAVDTTERACAVYNPSLAANWLGPTSVESLPAHAELFKRFRTVAEAGGYHLMMRPADIGPDGVALRLVSGRQVFSRDRSPLPVAAAFLTKPETSTLRIWIRTSRSGVILGCQSDPATPASRSRWLPVFYIGPTGRFYGQHLTADQQVHQTEGVNDGRWHHIALVRSGDRQQLFVDGSLRGSTETHIDSSALTHCQAGSGSAREWPGGSQRWMPFDGEIEGLVVALRAWTAPEVADDLGRSRPPTALE